MTDIIYKVQETLHRYRMLRPGSRVLVAVSGGPDSVALLDILNRLKKTLSLELVVAHFDHGLRPPEDEAETRFVASLAESMDLPFVTDKIRPSPARRGAFNEEALRERRYDFLNRARSARGAHAIALGHTLSDQAETVIMRLLRGSGGAGLSGIPPVRHPDIVRPLIEITREEVSTYADHRKLPFMTDPSNLKTAHLRNRIRLDLLPRLKAYQPEIVHILGQTADILREEARWTETVARQWIRKHAAASQKDSRMVSLKAFIGLPLALRRQVARQMIRSLQGSLRRIHMRHIASVTRLATGPPQARLDLPNGVRVQRVYDTLLFTKRRGNRDDSPRKRFRSLLRGPGAFEVKAVPCTVNIDKLGIEQVPAVRNDSPWVALLDGARITFPLIMRNFEPGDRFIPLGMKGHKKVKDLFMEQKVPSPIRKSLPLLCQGEALVWVCGLRLDDRFKVRPETETVIRVSLEFPEPAIFGAWAQRSPTVQKPGAKGDRKGHRLSRGSFKMDSK